MSWGRPKHSIAPSVNYQTDGMSRIGSGELDNTAGETQNYRVPIVRTGLPTSYLTALTFVRSGENGGAAPQPHSKHKRAEAFRSWTTIPATLSEGESSAYARQRFRHFRGDHPTEPQTILPDKLHRSATWGSTWGNARGLERNQGEEALRSKIVF